MCGRFLLLTDLSIITESFGVHNITGVYTTGNNISPGQKIAVIIHKDGQNSLVNYRWGLIPRWAKDPSIGKKMINARAETISDKPAFRQAFKERRCLIIADGFYEWQKLGKEKKPFYFQLKSETPFGFAGLYESWISPDRQLINTCTIITTESNELIKPIHERMPVIVPKDLELEWVDPDNQNKKELLSILKPYPSSEMEISDPGSGGNVHPFLQ
jgi:putative SOS response-associated peptidase YedK